MRPVNLLPKEVRRVGRAGSGAGSRSYLVVGCLAASLVAVLAVVVTGNQIRDRKADVTRLQQEAKIATAKADALQHFASFKTMQEQRTATVTSLARSRFDWERVMRELAVVIPSDVWLVNITGSVVPGVELEDGAGLSARAGVTGPALEVVGCAPDQDSVAGFVSALEDIDGVTRVGVQSSSKSDQSSGAAAVPTGGSSGADCRTRSFITKFELVVAFDSAPVPPSANSSPAPVPASPASPTAPPGTGSAQQQPASVSTSTNQATDKARRATNTYIPGQ